MNAALLWKEWREQRWRCVLGTLVLTTLSAGLVRAQLVTTPESVLLVFGPLGLLLAVFLAMGSVATERADRTWEFLRAQPLGPAAILRTKWLVGAGNLAVALLAAGCAAHAAAWSRGLFDLPAPPIYGNRDVPASLGFLLVNSGETLWTLVAFSLVSLLAWYTVLFFILTRARNELHAGLGGVALTLACLAWLLQYSAAHFEVDWLGHSVANALWTSALINPLSPLVFVLDPPGYRLLATGVSVLVWIVGPLWLAGRLERARRLV